ncbi:CHAT domain-containing protein [Arthrobacter pascens]|nr:CHAT domain-containing protein [Arthrobacter pascens]
MSTSQTGLKYRISRFSRAGLLLAPGSGLPSLAAIGRPGGLLSPERVAGLRLTGSHVTTQACSTGLAREGSAGDALGVELGFLLSGASSLLTTHWDVPVEPAGEFCTRFYRAWLVDGLTRAEAWREAATSMRDEGRPALEWAAFSLSGYWQ